MISIQKLKKKVRIEYIILLSAALILFLVIRFSVKPEKPEQITKHKVALIKELKAFQRSSVKVILILPYELSSKKFKYVITDENDLKHFIQALSSADTCGIPGHSGPVYEGTIVLKSEDQEHKYLATIHKHNTSDLYLSNVFLHKISDDKYTKGNPKPVRVKGIGKWILKIAPKGIL